MQIPLESIPGTTNFFFDYIHNWEKVSHFYPHAYSIEAIVQFAEKIPPASSAHRKLLGSVLSTQQKKWGGRSDAVERLASGATAVIAGQQPGLFTGPLYSVFKALTAVKVARELEARDVPAVPVFWIASDDHDYQEIEWAGILDRDSSLHRVRTNLSSGEKIPVGWLKFDEDITSTVASCFDLLPPSEFSEEVRLLVESAYSPGVSPVDAFARMMLALFAETDLILVDPLDSDLQELADPILRRAAESNDKVRSVVTKRTSDILQAGYHDQVHIDDNFTGLFTYKGRARAPLHPDQIKQVTHFSPNVLLRPIVQDSIFPTAAYVAGPSEIAYLAQAAPIYECLGREMPPVFPRITATLLEQPVIRVMKKYGFQTKDVFGGHDYLMQLAVRSIQDEGVFNDVRDHVGDEIERLRAVLGAVDPTLIGALDNSKQKMMYQIESLYSRYVTATAGRHEILDRHLKTFTNRLFPDKKLQERVINVTSYLLRHGLELVSILDARLELDVSFHQTLRL